MTVVPQPCETGMSETTRALLAAAVPRNTTRAFAADRRCWEAFMRDRSRPALPLVSEDLADYVAILVTVGSPAAGVPMPLSEKTCQRRLVALCAWARDKGSQPPDLRAAQQVLRGHQRLTGGTAPARAAPITLPVLRALVAQAQLGEGPRPSLRSLRDTALLLAGFGLAARRSELVALNVEHVTFTVQGAAVRLHRRKTHDVAVTMPLPHAIDPLVCPVRALSALQAELTARGLGAGPIFRRVSRTDVSGDRLHASSVTVIVAGLAEATGLPVPAGYESWSAHGLRRGLASEARKAGADRWAIARAGSWSASSKSLETYVDDLQVWEQSALRGLL